MDHSRIDDLTRFVARRTGRRSFATGIIGGLFATVTSGPGLTGTARKKSKRAVCKKPKRRCGRKCVNVRTSRKHRGKCNRRCMPTHVCRRGKCTPRPCGKGGPCRVFLTGSTHDGNLGGLAGADFICNLLAEGAGLPGTYRAWLSDENESPSTRFIKNPGPYVLINGTRIANNWTDLTDGSLLAPINITESGGPPVGSPVWTGTLSSGNASTSTCTNWTSASGNGVRGDSNATNAAWSNLLVTDCSIPRKLYCFQQS